MKIVFAALLLVGAIASPPADASDSPQVFTAYTTGELSIDADGRVVDLKVDRKKLDVAVMRDAEAQMRQWRFEPILENGQPVGARARMSINLVAIQDPGVEGFRVAFDSVHFRELAQDERGKSPSHRLPSPTYPHNGLVRGVGARVNLLLRLDEEGRVSQAAVTRLDLLGNVAGNDAVAVAAEFIRSSERSANQWRIPNHKSRAVVVPVRFLPPGTKGDRWIRTLGVPVDVPAWVVAEQASTGAVALDVGGVESSERWKLVTPLGS